MQITNARGRDEQTISIRGADVEVRVISGKVTEINSNPFATFRSALDSDTYETTRVTSIRPERRLRTFSLRVLVGREGEEKAFRLILRKNEKCVLDVGDGVTLVSAHNQKSDKWVECAITVHPSNTFHRIANAQTVMSVLPKRDLGGLWMFAAFCLFSPLVYLVMKGVLATLSFDKGSQAILILIGSLIGAGVLFAFGMKRISEIPARAHASSFFEAAEKIAHQSRLRYEQTISNGGLDSHPQVYAQHPSSNYHT